MYFTLLVADLGGVIWYGDAGEHIAAPRCHGPAFLWSHHNSSIQPRTPKAFPCQSSCASSRSRFAFQQLVRSLHGWKVAGRLSKILQVDALHLNEAYLFMQLLDAEVCVQMVMMM